MTDLAPGAMLGQYQIQAPVGHGGMAAVYRAYQPSLSRVVAVKVMTTAAARDPEFVARFKQEANFVAQLMHPNILPVYDFGEQRQMLYIAMAYVPGGTLKQHTPKPTERTLIGRIIGQVADALDYAHKRGIVHRDIKPSNILMAENDWALLADFGIARMVKSESDLTGTGVSIGTPDYMSPEQALGKRIDSRSDIYSLGAVLFELLTGRLPYQSDSPMGMALQHINEPLPLPTSYRPDLPPEVENVIVRAMAKRPDDRYATAAEFKAALEAALPAAPGEQSAAVRKVRNVLYQLEFSDNAPQPAADALEPARVAARPVEPPPAPPPTPASPLPAAAETPRPASEPRPAPAATLPSRAEPSQSAERSAVPIVLAVAAVLALVLIAILAVVLFGMPTPR